MKDNKTLTGYVLLAVVVALLAVTVSTAVRSFSPEEPERISRPAAIDRAPAADKPQEKATEPLEEPTWDGVM
ncbi:MAG: hypothetical protein ABIJ00_07890 [Candidatus Eisenbacteria bacterium]